MIDGPSWWSWSRRLIEFEICSQIHASWLGFAIHCISLIVLFPRVAHCQPHYHRILRFTDARSWVFFSDPWNCQTNQLDQPPASYSWRSVLSYRTQMMQQSDSYPAEIAHPMQSNRKEKKKRKTATGYWPSIIAVHSPNMLLSSLDSNILYVEMW